MKKIGFTTYLFMAQASVPDDVWDLWCYKDKSDNTSLILFSIEIITQKDKPYNWGLGCTIGMLHIVIGFPFLIRD